MFTCARCQATVVAGEVEREAGDWILRCSLCGAKNILANTLVNKIPIQTPTFQVAGWRE